MSYLKLFIAIFFSFVNAYADFEEFYDQHNLNPFSEDCLSFVSELKESDTKYDVGILYAPLSIKDLAKEDKDSIQTVRIFYWHRLIKNENNEVINPLVLINGGPGSTSWNYKRYINTYKNKNVSFISFDQRGNGCSSNIDFDTATTLYLKNFGSRNIVHDMELIKNDLLGENIKWNLLGSSYGGHITRRYMELFPSSLNLSVSHGFTTVLDNYKYRILRQDSFLKNEQMLFKQCPKLKETIKSIRRNPISNTKVWSEEISDYLEITYSEALDAFGTTLAFNIYYEGLCIFFENFQTEIDSLDSNAEEMLYINSLYKLINWQLNQNLPNPIRNVVNTIDRPSGDWENPIYWKKYQEGINHYNSRISDYNNYNAVHLSTFRFYNYDFFLKETELNSEKLEHITYDPIDLSKIKENFSNDNNLKFITYASEHDPIMPPVLFKYEKNFLGIDDIAYDEKIDFSQNQTAYKEQPNYGHEGALSETILDEIIEIISDSK